MVRQQEDEGKHKGERFGKNGQDKKTEWIKKGPFQLRIGEFEVSDKRPDRKESPEQFLPAGDPGHRLHMHGVDPEKQCPDKGGLPARAQGH